MPSYSLQHPITEARRKRGYTIREVARRAQVSRTSLVKVENGKRDRLEPDACLALIDLFPELDLKRLLEWDWAAERARTDVINNGSLAKRPSKH